MADGVDGRGRFYERLAGQGDWDALTNVHETARRLRLVFEAVLGAATLRDARFLDAGSGGGHFAAAAGARGARVTALDVGPRLLAAVARRSDALRVVASTLALPFPDATFDVVLSTEVVEHTPAPRRALGELVRVLRPGGRLVVTTPGRLWQPVVRLATRLGLRPYEGHENFLWPREAARTLAARGVRVDRCVGFNLLPVFTPALEPLHRVLDRAGRAIPWLFVNFLVTGVKA